MELMKWAAPARRDLWDAFEDMRSEIERGFGSLTGPEVAGLLDRTTSPAIDVVETQGEYLVIADLPGVDRKEIELSVTGSLLSIKGEKREEKGSERRRIFRKETWAGSFHRTIDLPAAMDPSKIEAELKDGVLTVRISKREEAKTKQIVVTAK